MPSKNDGGLPHQIYCRDAAISRWRAEFARNGLTIDHRTTAITIAMMVPETGRVKKTETSVCDILSDWRNAFSLS